MDTNRMSDAEREMRALIEEHGSSGQSLAQFADARGVPRWKLYDWRRRIEQRDARALTEQRFATVKIVEEDSDRRRPSSGASIEVVLRGGRTLVVRGDVDGEQLKRVVLALEAC